MKIATQFELEFIASHIDCDVKSLALSLSKRNDIDKDFIIRQIAGFQIIKKKIPSWYNKLGLVLPQHLPLEQCSSELTAKYKASLCSGQSLCDLTGGFGVDFAFMSASYETSTYIEQQPELCEIMQHNSQIIGIEGINIINDNSETVLNSPNCYSCIYVDPARRSESGNKVVLLSHCQPDLSAIYTLLLDKCELLMAKLSPMLDISLALKQMPQTSNIHIVSVDNECKELLFISSKKASESCNLHCINLQQSKPTQEYIFTHEQERNALCEYTNLPLEFLYEPNASIMKAGAFKSIACSYGLKKLHPQSHLYTANKAIDNFPGRLFRVISCFSPNKTETKQQLGNLTSANISTRNFPIGVAELRKKLKLNEGGNCYLFATTLNDEKKVIIKCEKA